MTTALATLTVIRDAGNARNFTGSSGRRMYLYTESGKLALAVDVAPREIEYGNLNADWAEAERSGTLPLLLHSSDPLDTMAFSFMLTDKYDHQQPITGSVATLRQIARTRERVMVRYGPSEAGLWRVTSASVSSELRSEATSEITRATVSITLTRASDAAPAVGPVSKPAPPPPAKAKSTPRTYRVVKGDCLWDIARKFYGPSAGPSWPKIFDANRDKIKDPHWIFPGQVFVIP
jgi:LysM repeat protein